MHTISFYDSTSALVTVCSIFTTNTCTIFHGTSQITGISYSGVIAGVGDCNCNTERCECTCKCNTAPKSGQPYFGTGCQCDPDYCYNEDYHNVSDFQMHI